MVPWLANYGYCQKSQYGRKDIDVIITHQNPVKPVKYAKAAISMT